MDRLRFVRLYCCSVVGGLLRLVWIVPLRTFQQIHQDLRQQRSLRQLLRRGSPLQPAPRKRPDPQWWQIPPLLRIYHPLLRRRRLIQLQQRRRELQQELLRLQGLQRLLEEGNIEELLHRSRRCR